MSHICKPSRIHLSNASLRADFLVVNREELVASVQQEIGLAEIEVQIELAETLAHITALGLDELDYTKWKKRKETQLREEGVIEKGQGVVAIVADSAAPVFSVFAPLATSVAASNAAICIASRSFSGFVNARGLTRPRAFPAVGFASRPRVAPPVQAHRESRPSGVPLQRRHRP